MGIITFNLSGEGGGCCVADVLIQYLLACTSEQGNVIGLVSVYIYMSIKFFL